MNHPTTEGPITTPPIEPLPTPTPHLEPHPDHP